MTRYDTPDQQAAALTPATGTDPQFLGPAAPSAAIQPAPPAPAPAIPQPMRRAPVTYEPSEPGWWLAADGLWYPPETNPGTAASPIVSGTGDRAQTVVVQVGATAQQAYAPFVTSPLKSRVAAGLLGIFLGVFGVHRFYLGYSGVGVAMLLISILSLGILAPFVALWGFIEGIVLLCGGMSHDRWGRALT
jgi:TM2 domain-containing membrane protein YozV